MSGASVRRTRFHRLAATTQRRLSLSIHKPYTGNAVAVPLSKYDHPRPAFSDKPEPVLDDHATSGARRLDLGKRRDFEIGDGARVNHPSTVAPTASS